MTKLEVATEALKIIADPISVMKRDLKPDEQLNGQFAYQLSNDPNYLKNIAKKALSEIEA